MIKVKTFVQALRGFAKDPQKTRSYFDDRRLTLSEKNVLKAFFLYRDNKLQEALDCLIAITGALDPVVVGLKDLITGMTLANQSHFKEGIPYLENSLDILVKYKLEYFRFLALANLFVVHLNLKDKKNTKTILMKLKAFPDKTEWQMLYLMRSHFNFFLLLGKYNEAEEILAEIEGKRNIMSEGDIINHLVAKFDFGIKKKDFDLAQNTLKEMTKYRKYHLTSNYNFMKILLDHYLNQTPIYVENSDFKDCPLLFYQIQLIKSLEEQNQKSAKTSWDKLHHMNSEIYQSDFSYHGDPCLFSLCLSLYETSQKKLSPPTHGSPSSSLYEKFKIIFLQSPGVFFEKEKLYFMVWGREIESKDDLGKLSQYIYLLRTKDRLEIKMKKGCYCLVPVEQKKVS